MSLLLIASLVWAFSFGLIKHNLAGLPTPFVTGVRLGLSLLVFLPWLRMRGLRPRTSAALLGLGAIEFGLMYLTYIHSFRYLAAHQVALFTILTPLYVTLIHDAVSRRFHPRFLGAALMAIVGTAVISYLPGTGLSRPVLVGFLWVQASNLCFAAGQIGYAHLRHAQPAIRDHEVFALMYLGAVITAALPLALAGPVDPASVTPIQWVTLLYLGMLPSGVCFFLWNKGATRTNAGTLAVMNNAKIPLAIAASLLLFGERTSLLRLALGGAIIAAAVWINERSSRASA